MEFLDPEEARRAGAVLIAGPTASGKSAMALALAEATGGVIINADSMQVYRELRILTARPSALDEARAPHRLYGHVPAAQRHSVGRWRDEIAPVLADCRAEGRLPIVVGGTGLYFRALTAGLVEVPAIPDGIRAALLARAATEPVEALHAELARRDPEEGRRLRPTDRTRVLRALEVLEATGRSLSAWQREPGTRPLVDPARAVRIVLEPERAQLYARIGRRFDGMVAAGALDEVSALLALGLDADLPAMKAIGVREFGAHLAGALPLDEAIERAKMETRRYAKRQSTWFRNQMGDWPRARP